MNSEVAGKRGAKKWKAKFCIFSPHFPASFGNLAPKRVENGVSERRTEVQRRNSPYRMGRSRAHAPWSACPEQRIIATFAWHPGPCRAKGDEPEEAWNRGAAR